MQELPVMPRWLSAHLYFDGGIYDTACDSVIRGPAHDMIAACHDAGCSDSAFFVRYIDSAAHVRVRFRCRDDASEAMSRHVATTAVERSNALLSKPRVSIAWSTYEPEYVRYGGVRGVAIAERLFAASSETAMAVFDRIGLMSRERRLGVALPCAISTLAAFHDDSASAGKACRLYAAGNISLAGSSSSAAEAMRQLTRMAERNARRVGVRLREIWNAARDSQPIEPALDRYGEEARSARARLDEAENKGEIAPRIATNGPYLRMSFAQWVLPSYLHMMNNRLGLSRVAEAEVALLLSEALKWSDNGAEAHATNNA